MTELKSKMSNELSIPERIITSKIYLLRDQKVMLDCDLAVLYQGGTKRINEQVKRNKERPQVWEAREHYHMYIRSMAF